MCIRDSYQDLFCTTPGTTNEAEHHIPTTGTPVHVPPRCIPVHYHDEVEAQIQKMLEQGIIEESSSPWMAPTVFVKKKSGELRICVDYRELNKNTKRDAYPLPLPDEVQNRLAAWSHYFYNTRSSVQVLAGANQSRRQSKDSLLPRS